MDENQKVKLEFIEAYLNNAEAKLLFLSELAETGHRDEAMTLCLVYIDRFAQVLKWPSTESGKNFVEALIQFGQDPFMGLYHPLQATRVFSQFKKLEMLGRQVATVFPGPSHDLMDLPTFEARMEREIPQFDRSQFRKTCLAGDSCERSVPETSDSCHSRIWREWGIGIFTYHIQRLSRANS